MPPSHLAPSAKPLSGRHLTDAEREENAIWRAQRHGVREIARRLERAPSTISRELRRNAATRSGGLAYRATTAQMIDPHPAPTLRVRLSCTLL
jgi:IS30 family transposase